jgi:hypothetical protein
LSPKIVVPVVPSTDYIWIFHTKWTIVASETGLSGCEVGLSATIRVLISDLTLSRCNLILRSVVSSRAPRVSHSFRYGGAPYRFLYGGAPYKSPKVVENRAACSGCDSLAARAVDTYLQKSLNCREKRRLRRISEVQPDLRESLIFLPTVESSCAGPSAGRRRSVAGRRPIRPSGIGRRWPPPA